MQRPRFVKANGSTPFTFNLRSLMFPIIIGVVATNIGCKNDPTGTSQDSLSEPTLTASNPRLILKSPAETGIDFQNIILESWENNITNNINIYNGGGIAIADINNDALPDVYFISSNGKNRLYLNQGNLQFKDITDAAGVASEDGFETGVTAVDINADGLLDLYVCRAGPTADEARRNKLFINNGNNTFSEKAREYGLDDKSASNGANFFDYDGDGDLDLYLLNYPTDFSYASKIDARPSPDGQRHVPNLDPKKEFDSDRLYRNDGGKFTDVSKQAGIWNFAFGLSASVSDFNFDGRPDVYVANDFIQPDFLYINNGNGTFTESLAKYFRHTTQHTMGTDLSDFNNDGLIDLFAVDMLANSNQRQKTLQTTNSLSRYTTLMQYGYFEPVVRNVLQRNNGNGTFSDVGCIAGVYKTDWSWSGLLIDLDNDGRKDLHVTNGYRREVTDLDFINYTFSEIKKQSKPLPQQFPNIQAFLDKIPTYKLRNYVFQNKGDLLFEDKTGDWMTAKGSWSNGAVWADLDADGDLDMVVSNLEEPAFVYENASRKQPNSNYLQVRCQGDASNPFGVGASVAIQYGSETQYLENYPSRGIFSSVEHLFHFGLGSTSQIDKLTIRWADGQTQTLTNLPVNQRLTLKKSDAAGKTPTISPAANAAGKKLFAEKTTTSGLNWRHVEDPFNDFEKWFLNPWKETELGPFMAKGDANGDGLEDFFIGNSFDHPAALFAQTADGRFRLLSAPTWAQDKLYEDHGAVFFDADGDKDQDLFVVSGGMEATSDLAWQPRLYLNDGKGNFKGAANALPAIKDIGARAAAHDFDGDGDLDLFVGGRIVAGKWPLSPRSYILKNDGGRFSDATAQVGGEFEHCGMVTDLAWVNVDADPQPELVVTGEWMPITVFKLNNGKLQNITAPSGLDRSNGLWNRLCTADLDGDGDMDLVTANFGLNTRFQASAEAPLRCYAKDFDGNGSMDPIMASYENGRIHPLYQKDLLIKQMPVLKKKFLYAKDYGVATIDAVWPQKDLDAALNLSAYTLQSCWWENQGGKFTRHDLPREAQISAVQSIAVDDFNADGQPDLLLIGNKYGIEVETNRCDAGNGALFLGDGKGNFTYLPNLQSGIWAQKEARDVVVLRGSGNKKTIVVSNNNDVPQVFGQ